MDAQGRQDTASTTKGAVSAASGKSTGSWGRVAAALRGRPEGAEERAGSPPYRQLALRAHCSAASLSVAAGGRRLPSLAVTLAYVQACGGDVREWRHRWQLLAAELAADAAARRRALDVGRAPYPGAAAFEAVDADRFFGREALLDRLVSVLAERRLVIVTGPSGAGEVVPGQGWSADQARLVPGGRGGGRGRQRGRQQGRQQGRPGGRGGAAPDR